MISKYNIKWHIPANIDYFISTNQTGNSKGKYKHANFSKKVGDVDKIVDKNIIDLKDQLHLKHIAFMNQTHSNTILRVAGRDSYLDCDAIFTENRNIACAVLTADCIPILITEKTGSIIGCIHAGWRGLKSQIIQKFFKHFSTIPPHDFRVLLGPCISQNNYEVNDEIITNFLNYSKRLKKNTQGNYYMDLRHIAYDILNELGITNVTMSGACTYNDNFYSYRRDKITGRFISLIWFKNDF
tara:strand:+ start:8849 stop:9571 length:723 start_codon:yes stop_codon:yes gene_type:complete